MVREMIFQSEEVYVLLRMEIPYKEFDLEFAIKQVLCEYLMKRGTEFRTSEVSYRTFLNWIPNDLCRKYGFEKTGIEKHYTVDGLRKVTDIECSIMSYQEIVSMLECLKQSCKA